MQFYLTILYSQKFQSPHNKTSYSEDQRKEGKLSVGFHGVRSVRCINLAMAMIPGEIVNESLSVQTLERKCVFKNGTK